MKRKQMTEKTKVFRRKGANEWTTERRGEIDCISWVCAWIHTIVFAKESESVVGTRLLVVAEILVFWILFLLECYLENTFNFF